MPKNLEQKGLTKVVKVCVKITPDFVSKCQMDIKRGIIVLRRCQQCVGGCTPALADFMAGYFRHCCLVRGRAGDKGGDAS
jgi:hypothetical protein